MISIIKRIVTAHIRFVDEFDKNRPMESLDDFWFHFKYYVPYSIRNSYYRIRDFFSPRQKWLTKKIPVGWADKDRIWEICIFEGIKHYVEEWGEDCFNILAHGEDTEEPQRTFMNEVRENYTLLVCELPRLEKELAKAWDRVPGRASDDINAWLNQINNPILTYEEQYGEVDRLDQAISDLKTKVMVWAVTKRESIWT